MLKKILFVWLFASILNAAEFTATVLNNKLSVGDRVVLSLSLVGAKADEAPDLSALIRDFTIYNQQQYSSYHNVNGNVTAETGWDITLLPKIEGSIIIPSLEVHTDHGILRSAEIALQVSNQPSATSNSKDTLGVSLIATTNKDRAYVKEPILYTLKLISYKPIVNVTLEDIKAPDAIIDKIGEPKQYEQILGGVRAHIIELQYYITPLVAGNIEIIPAEIRGEIQGPPQQQTHRNHRFGLLNNFFFENAVEFKPFSLKSNKIAIKSITLPIKSSDWLPLQNLTISEEWVGLAHAKVGETIVRKIKLTATGGFSNQLPSVQSFMELSGVKTYADKPVLKDEIKKNTQIVISTKEESFSLVPQQDGKIIFPAIKVVWWNLQTKKLETAILPAKTIDVAPGVVVNNADATVVDYSNPATEIKPTNNSTNYLVLSLIGIIVLMAGCILYLIKRKPTKNISPEKAIVKNKDIVTVDDLRATIIKYANKHWDIPVDVTLNKIGTLLTHKNYIYDTALYVDLCQQLNATMYASAHIELPVLIQLWDQFRLSVNKNRTKQVVKHEEDYINLNPT